MEIARLKMIKGFRLFVKISGNLISEKIKNLIY